MEQTDKQNKPAGESRPQGLYIPHWIGLVFGALGIFLGSWYWFSGALQLVLIPVVIFFVLFLLLTPKLRSFKQDREKMTVEALTAISLFVIGVAGFIPFFHGVDIEISSKQEIQQAAIERVEAGNELLDDYGDALDDKKVSFRTRVKTERDKYLNSKTASSRSRLDSLLGAGTVDYGKDEAQIAEDIEAAIEAKLDGIEGEFDIDEAEEEWTKYAKKSRAAFENWDYFTVGFYIEDIKNAFEELSTKAESTMPDFQYEPQYQYEQPQLTDPIASMKTADTNRLVLPAGIYAFILLLLFVPYLLTKRPKKMRFRGKVTDGDYGTDVQID